MNIFDPHISGSLSVSGSGNISGDLTVLGTINATISGTTSNAISASHAANYTLTSSFGDFTSSYSTGSFTGSFIGDGSGLINIPASGVTGLNLTQIADGSVTASVSNSNGLRVNSNTEITGSLTVTGDIIGGADFNTLRNKPTLVSGSSQINITGTTGYSTITDSISNLSSSVGTISGAIATTDLNQDNRLNSIEGKTGSYSTTGSNSFVGDQTITGSLIVTQNLQVLGSSSLIYVTSSQLNVSSSTISVNVLEPAERFGGLKIYDSGSSSATASFLWDSLNNRFVYQNVDGATYNGAMFIAGPRNSGSLGEEPTLTSGKIPKSVGGDHIDNSIMSEVGGNTIAIAGGLVITGSILSTVTPLVSGSSQIDITSTTNYTTFSSSIATTTLNVQNRVSSLETASGSLNSFTSSINTTIKNKLNTEGVISGSSQVLNGSGIRSGSAQLPSGVVSGSSQVSYSGISGVPSGIVSGSSQVTLSSTSGFGTYLNQAVLTTSSPTFAGLNGGGAYFTSQGASNNSPSTPSANIGVYAGTYAFIDLSTSDSNGSWIDFSKANGTDYSGRIRYVNGTDTLSISTGGSERINVNGSGLSPYTNGSYNLGSSSNRWNVVYTSDLSLSNGIGDYTIVEGENDLFLYNNKQNKVYKFMLQEVNPEDATPKRLE